MREAQLCFASRGISSSVTDRELLLALRDDMQSLKSDVQNLKSEIKREMEVQYSNWFRRNERAIYASLTAGVVAMFGANAVYTQHLRESHRIELLARESASESRTCTTIVSGAMSGDVFTVNAKRAVKRSLDSDAS